MNRPAAVRHRWLPALRVSALALGLTGPSVCVAALRWESRQEERTATAGDASVSAVYRFANAGSETVKILSMRPSCSCTTAEATSLTIHPGESGAVTAVFHLGDRFGQQQKTIAVITDDPLRSDATLVLRVAIAEVVKCTPRLVRWHRGEPPAEKTIELEAAPSQMILDLAPAPTGGPAEISSRVEVLASGRKFRLCLKPRSTDAPLSAPLSCIAQIAGRPAVKVLVYAVVD